MTFTEDHGAHGAPKADIRDGRYVADHADPLRDVPKPHATVHIKKTVNIDRPNGKHVEVTHEVTAGQLIFTFWQTNEGGSPDILLSPKMRFGISLEEWRTIEDVLEIDE